MKPKIKKTFALQYFTEPLSRFPDYAERRMFGCLAIYLGQKNCLVLAENPEDEQWNGILIPTFFEHQASLIADFPALVPHPILKKWLYLPLSHPDFEQVALSLVARIAKRDERFGIPIASQSKSKRKRPWMNLGPKSKAALAEVGLTRPEQLKKLGWKKVLEKVLKKSPEFLNLNFAVAVQGAILGQDWRSFSVREKAPLEKWIKEKRLQMRASARAPRSKKKSR